MVVGFWLQHPQPSLSGDGGSGFDDYFFKKKVLLQSAKDSESLSGTAAPIKTFAHKVIVQKKRPEI